jgi:hypothetical protein
MASRPPRSRHLDGGSSVPVDLTSIDADEYRAGFNCGPRGDDSEDLGTADLFGAFGAMDGDDGIRMATPSSIASTAMPTVMPGATTMVTEERRLSLTSDMVEMISCLKDWELGAAQQQHEVENEEVLSTFQELFIDEDVVVFSETEWWWTDQVRVDSLFLSRVFSCS